MKCTYYGKHRATLQHTHKEKNASQRCHYPPISAALKSVVLKSQGECPQLGIMLHKDILAQWGLPDSVPHTSHLVLESKAAVLSEVSNPWH
jgi:hypothetical protein